MQKKQFEAVAAIIRNAQFLTKGTRETIALQFAIAFAREFPNFRRDVFLDACDPLKYEDQ